MRLFKLLFKQMNISEMKKQSKNRAHHLKQMSLFGLYGHKLSVLSTFICVQ